MSEKFVILKNIVKSFKTTIGDIVVLKDLSFEIEEGEFVVIAGPSGAGKTTLLNLLGGMDSATDGKIFVGGKDVTAFREKELTEYRRGDVGFVFQFYNLMPNLTALENIELAVEICKNPLCPKEILKSVGLESREKHFPAGLSGGEQQRVSIARAVAKNPKIILCDEPTGALDYETGKRVLKLLHEICRTQNKTVIIVTHNSALKEMADRVIVIKNGRAEKVIKNKNPKDIGSIEW